MTKVTQNMHQRQEEEIGLAGMVEKHLRRYIRAHDAVLPSSGLYDRIIREVERPILRISLEVCKGNQNKTAKLLGINRNTLRKKITEHNLDGDIEKMKQL